MNFTRAKTYTFSTLAPDVLGAEFKVLKVESILSLEDAINHDANLVSKHENVKLKVSGLPQDPATLNYIKFKDQKNKVIVLADEWINQDTIVEDTAVNLAISLNNASLSDITKLRNILISNGYGDKITDIKTV